MNPASIGHYRIVGVLGEGGMGTVYEAVQELPNRAVALKVIRPDFVSPEMSRRFARESEVLGRLQHPGIAQIYEAGTADGPHGPQAFFAMELVRGQTLTAYADGRALDLTRRLELFARVCDAVHYAHQQGVVHRDLKPANILVDAAGQPKILDFGVARLTNADTEATRQTTVGQVVGTLQYMSPEQVNADPAQIDARSDVYSLGVVLYELVAGRLPYDLARKMIIEAVGVILLAEPAPLSSVDRRLAGDVEIIVGKALEKERARRYDSADDLAGDIRRFIRDEPIVARRASAVYQLRKFARRNRALVGGIALAAAALLVGTVVSTALALRATAAERVADARRRDAVAAGALAERRRAVADSALHVADSARADALREQAAATASAVQATSEAEKARAIDAFLQQMLASSDPANARGKDLTVRELLDQAGAAAATDPLARQPEVRAAVASTIGRTYFALGLYDPARRQLDSAYAIRRRVLGARSLPVAESADELGKLASATGDAPLAERRLTEALATMRATLPPNDDHITSALAALGDVRQQQGRFPDAARLYREALARTRIRHGGDGAEVAMRLQSLGGFLGYTGGAAEAQTLLAQAVSIQRRVHGPNHPAVVDALVALSDAQVNVPDYAASERTLREALPIAQALYGAEHPVIANVLSRLGTALVNQGRTEEPEGLLRRALAMRIKLLGEQHPDVQLARIELGRLLQQLQRYDETDTLYTQALEERRALLGASSPAVASSLLDVARLANLRENSARAEQKLREAAPIWHAAGIEDQELYTLAELGRTLAKLDRFREADSVLSYVLTRRRALFGDAHWSVGDTYTRMATVAIGLGAPVRAESLARAGLAIARKVYGERAPSTIGPLSALALATEARGDTAAAIPLTRDVLSMLASRPPGDASVINVRRALAVDLCATGSVPAGDSLLRQTIDRARLDSTHIASYRLRGALGYCLTRAGKFEDAEQQLLHAEAGLRAYSKTAGPHAHDVVVQWLASLYDQWGRPAEAATWRRRVGQSQGASAPVARQAVARQAAPRQAPLTHPPMTTEIRFDDGAAYERFMGVWSRTAGETFLSWLAPRPGLRWLDVGCGNGAFTALLAERCAPASVDGVDPSDGQLAYARTRFAAAPTIRLQRGDAMALPFADASVDAAVMPLVIFFVPDPAKGVAEMARAVAPGGLVTAYAWDMHGGGFPYASLQQEMRDAGLTVPRPPSPDASRLDDMAAFWRGAGLEEVETRAIDVERTFADFDDYWGAALGGPSVSSGLASLGEDGRAQFAERMRARLGADAGGRVTCSARANAVRGRVPATR